MKKIILFLLFIFSASVILAESNPFLTLFRKYFPNDYSNTKNIRTFVGDSIYFDIQSGAALHNIFKEVPDTLWLKERKSKKPKNGKDYLLYYNYKGVNNGKSFYTPASAFDKKVFGFLTFKEIQEGSYFPKTVGYDLSLIELETANIIHVIIDKSTGSNWKLYSWNANNKINKWIGKHFYEKSYYGSALTDYTLTFGDIYLELSFVANTPFFKPHAEFILTSENADPLNLVFGSNSSLSYRIESMKFLSDSEYQSELDKKKVYTINYELPQDSTFKTKIEVLPFKTIWGKTNSYSSYVSQTIQPGYSPLGHHTIPHDTYVLIGDKITVRDKDYYKAVLHGKSFFIECSKVDIDNPDLLTTLLSQPQEVRDAFFDFAKIVSRFRYNKERLKNLKAFQKLIERGFVVVEANPYDMSEYTDGTGMKFSFLNTSNNTIKYITINFIGYNAVDDPVSSRGKTLLTRKCIGPVEPFETASYDFEYIWFTDIVDYSKIRSIVVQYKNGTSKTYTGDAVKTASDDVINALDYKSPVIDFLPTFEEDKE